MEAIGRLSRHYVVSQGIPKSIFKTYVTIGIFLYHTLIFIITVLKVRSSGYRWMEGGGFLRWGKEVGRFRISIFAFQYLHFEFQSDQIRKWIIKKWSKPEGIFHTQY